MDIRRQADLAFVDLPGRASADPFPDEPADATARVVLLEPLDHRCPHRHPHSSELVYVAGGQGRVWQDGEVADVGTGDLVRVPAGTPHATLAVGGPMLLVCFFPHPALGDNIEELPEIVLGPDARPVARRTS